MGKNSVEGDRSTARHDGELRMWMKDRRGMCAWTGWKPIMPHPQ